MRFLIVNTDYPEFLRWLYEQHTELAARPYDEQMRVRMESLFGVADFYARNLRRLGHDALDLIVNNEPAQRAWAHEHGLEAGPTERRQLHLRGGVLPWISRKRDRRWLHDILRAQIEHYRPDVVLNQAMDGIGCTFWKTVESHIGLLVGQHAATELPNNQSLSCYDLALSSFPPTVDALRKRGLRAALHRLAFEPGVLSALNRAEPCHEITFVGSLGTVHTSRIELLEALCERFPGMKIWAPTIDHLPPTSPIRRHYVGAAWGRDMYQILRQSRITINHHGNVPPFANNLRLYEATGVGTLLLTDHKADLPDLFAPDREVLAYRDAAECIALAERHLSREDERAAIALAGQRRTLEQHTYLHRMRELVETIARHAGRGPARSARCGAPAG